MKVNVVKPMLYTISYDLKSMARISTVAKWEVVLAISLVLSSIILSFPIKNGDAP